jgi:lipopolysaccharide/colanic/teichoic acid biosynthesis glycosyltransferase
MDRVDDVFMCVDYDDYNKQKERYNRLINKNNNTLGGFYVRRIKRLFDFIISLICCIITIPTNLLIAVITFFDVGRPLFFKQKRVGKDLRLITIYKFRNMRNTCDENGVLLPPEKRVTKIGKVIRAASLDELLQFWNILFGQMSIIGPRPLPANYLERYTDEQILRHRVNPGLECPYMAVRGQHENWNNRFDNDIRYVNNISLRTDTLQVIRLVRLLFDRQNNSIRKNGSMKELPKQDISRVA